MPPQRDMTGDLENKILCLRRRLRSLESAVVAFSGGVDSSLLAVLAHEELGEGMLAATALSPSLPARDRGVVTELCRRFDIPHIFVETREMQDPLYSSNPPERCYHCKRHLAAALLDLADSRNLRFLVEGTNASDLSDHRPGRRAIGELERATAPLIDCGITKQEVRELARQLGIPVADRPAAACLASRVPEGVEITPDLLSRIDRAEEILKEAGASQVRVRHHGEIARIELDEGSFPKVLPKRPEISERIRALGWRFVTLDLMGYRTGGMRG